MIKDAKNYLRCKVLHCLLEKRKNFYGNSTGIQTKLCQNVFYTVVQI
jgi:hypothetical protein